MPDISSPSSPPSQPAAIWLDYLPNPLQERVASLLHTDLESLLPLSKVSREQRRAVLTVLQNTLNLPLPEASQANLFLSDVNKLSVSSLKGAEQATSLVIHPSFDGSALSVLNVSCYKGVLLCRQLQPKLPNVSVLSISMDALWQDLEWVPVFKLWPLRQLHVTCGRYKVWGEGVCNHICTERDLEKQHEISQALPSVIRLGITCFHEKKSDDLGFLGLIRALPALKHVTLYYCNKSQPHILSQPMISALRTMESVSVSNHVPGEGPLEEPQTSSIQVAANIGANVVALHDDFPADDESVNKMRHCTQLRALELRVKKQEMLLALHGGLVDVVGNLRELSLCTPVRVRVLHGEHRLVTVFYSVNSEQLLKVLDAAPLLRKLHLHNLRFGRHDLLRILKRLGDRLVDFGITATSTRQPICARLVFILRVIARYNPNISNIQFCDLSHVLEYYSQKIVPCKDRCPLITRQNTESDGLKKLLKFLARKVPALPLTEFKSVLAVVHPKLTINDKPVTVGRDENSIRTARVSFQSATADVP